MNWLFDLDETLHHAGHAVFPRISQRMTDYIVQHLGYDQQQANLLRTHYWRRYGATLGGLVRHHHVSADHFLRFTHDMDELLPWINYSNRLPQLLRSLPGRKWVFSNGPQHYVEAITAHLGIGHLISRCYGMEALDYKPKPRSSGYHRVLRDAGVAAGNCVMVEDTAANLRTAKRLGMQTVWISPALRKPGWVDWRITDLQQLATLPLGR